MDMDGIRANPKYVKKSFTITYKLIDGVFCGEGGADEPGKVESIVSFKLKNTDSFGDSGKN